MSSTGVEIIDRPDMYASVFMYGTNPRNRRVNQLNYDAVGKIRSYEGNTLEGGSSSAFEDFIRRDPR